MTSWSSSTLLRSKELSLQQAALQSISAYFRGTHVSVLLEGELKGFRDGQAAGTDV